MKKGLEYKIKMLLIIVVSSCLITIAFHYLQKFFEIGKLSLNSMVGTSIIFGTVLVAQLVTFAVLILVCKRRSSRENYFLRMKNGSEGKFRAIIEKSDGIIFEWDIFNNTVYFSDSWHTKFCYPIFSTDFLGNIVKHDIIHKDDVINFVTKANEIKSGTPYSEAVVRMRRWQKGYCWCKVYMMAIFDDIGEIIGATGIILDIDDEHSKVQVFQEKAERDSLTNLYNKGTTEHKIKDKLYNMTQDKIGAFFIIDIDNFKHFNDTYGHIFGDSVLKEVSAQIRSTFRANDVIGRIGGDEFVVYVDNMNNITEVENKAIRISKTFEKSLEKLNPQCNLSGSIGIAIFPNDAKEYGDLYKKADLALYRAKNNGKNQYCFYDNSME